MSSYLDISRACDAWLRKNCPQYTPGGGWNKSKFTQGNTPTQQNALPRKRKPRAKYATDEERRAAISAAVKARWAAMTKETKAARVTKIQANRPKKEVVPRHMRPEWKAYRLAWQRANRKPVTDPVEIQKRRDKARKRYAALDPVVRKERNRIRKERQRAKRKAEKEKGLQVA